MSLRTFDNALMVVDEIGPPAKRGDSPRAGGNLAFMANSPLPLSLLLVTGDRYYQNL
jgi:hypothetical protein